MIEAFFKANIAIYIMNEFYYLFYYSLSKSYNFYINENLYKKKYI